MKGRTHHKAARGTSNREKRLQEIEMTPALIICSFWCYLLYVQVINSQSWDRPVNKLRASVLTEVQKETPSCLAAHFQASIFHGELVVSSLILLCEKDYLRITGLKSTHSIEVNNMCITAYGTHKMKPHVLTLAHSSYSCLSAKCQEISQQYATSNLSEKVNLQ